MALLFAVIFVITTYSWSGRCRGMYNWLADLSWATCQAIATAVPSLLLGLIKLPFNIGAAIWSVIDATLDDLTRRYTHYVVFFFAPATCLFNFHLVKWVINDGPQFVEDSCSWATFIWSWLNEILLAACIANIALQLSPYHSLGAAIRAIMNMDLTWYIETFFAVVVLTLIWAAQLAKYLFKLASIKIKLAWRLSEPLRQQLFGPVWARILSTWNSAAPLRRLVNTVWAIIWQPIEEPLSPRKTLPGSFENTSIHRHEATEPAKPIQFNEPVAQSNDAEEVEDVQTLQGEVVQSLPRNEDVQLVQEDETVQTVEDVEMREPTPEVEPAEPVPSSPRADNLGKGCYGLPVFSDDSDDDVATPESPAVLLPKTPKSALKPKDALKSNKLVSFKGDSSLEDIEVFDDASFESSAIMTSTPLPSIKVTMAPDSPVSEAVLPQNSSLGVSEPVDTEMTSSPGHLSQMSPVPATPMPATVIAMQQQDIIESPVDTSMQGMTPPLATSTGQHLPAPPQREQTVSQPVSNLARTCVVFDIPIDTFVSTAQAQNQSAFPDIQSTQISANPDSIPLAGLRLATAPMETEAIGAPQIPHQLGNGFSDPVGLSQGLPHGQEHIAHVMPVALAIPPTPVSPQNAEMGGMSGIEDQQAVNQAANQHAIRPLQFPVVQPVPVVVDPPRTEPMSSAPSASQPLNAPRPTPTRPKSSSLLPNLKPQRAPPQNQPQGNAGPATQVVAQPIARPSMTTSTSSSSTSAPVPIPASRSAPVFASLPVPVLAQAPAQVPAPASAPVPAPTPPPKPISPTSPIGELTPDEEEADWRMRLMNTVYRQDVYEYISLYVHATYEPRSDNRIDWAKLPADCGDHLLGEIQGRFEDWLQFACNEHFGKLTQELRLPIIAKIRACRSTSDYKENSPGQNYIAPEGFPKRDLKKLEELYHLVIRQYSKHQAQQEAFDASLLELTAPAANATNTAGPSTAAQGSVGTNTAASSIAPADPPAAPPLAPPTQTNKPPNNTFAPTSAPPTLNRRERERQRAAAAAGRRRGR